MFPGIPTDAGQEKESEPTACRQCCKIADGLNGNCVNKETNKPRHRQARRQTDGRTEVPTRFDSILWMKKKKKKRRHSIHSFIHSCIGSLILLSIFVLTGARSVPVRERAECLLVEVFTWRARIWRPTCTSRFPSADRCTPPALFFAVELLLPLSASREVKGGERGRKNGQKDRTSRRP